jgi:hypothetical protein
MTPEHARENEHAHAGAGARQRARRVLYDWAVLRVLLLAALVLGGCATIAPYERERLSRPDMLLASSPELALGEGHATEVREGSVGGIGGAGGGCGCN